MSTAFSHVSRIHQLDAGVWNDELYDLLRTHLRKAMQHLPPGFLYKIEPKLQMLFKLLFWQLPLEIFGGTFGHRLLEMQYWDCSADKVASKHKLRVLTLLQVCLPSLWKAILPRLTYPTGVGSRNVFEIFENGFEIVYKCLRLVNFCIFLQKSRYPTILDRLLCIRPIYISEQKIREVSYESLHRELLWHGFAELLGFVLPMVNIHRIKGAIKRSCKLLHEKKEGPQVISNYNCPVCGQIPTYPHDIGCNHVFCYYCLASNVLADPQYSCTYCNHEASGLSSVRPL